MFPTVNQPRIGASIFSRMRFWKHVSSLSLNSKEQGSPAHVTAGASAGSGPTTSVRRWADVSQSSSVQAIISRISIGIVSEKVGLYVRNSIRDGNWFKTSRFEVGGDGQPLGLNRAHHTIHSAPRVQPRYAADIDI